MQNTEIKHMIVAFILFLMGIFFAWETRNLPSGFMQALPADVYPRVIAIVLAGLSMMKFIKNFIKYRSNKNNNEIEIKKFSFKDKYLRPVVIALLFYLYILAVPYIGYYETGLLFLVTSIFFLGENSFNWMMKSIFFSSLVIAVVYIVFTIFLDIYVPSGIII